jgi:hypothetical protein
MLPVPSKYVLLAAATILTLISATNAFSQAPASTDPGVTTAKAHTEVRNRFDPGDPNLTHRDNVDARSEDANSVTRSRSTTAEVIAANESAKVLLEPQTSNEGWQFQFTPYLWIAGLSGHAGIGDVVVDVNSGITDSDVHLNFGFMATFEARKDRLILLTDLQYSNLGTDRPRPQAVIFTSASADFKTFILDPEIGYRVAQNSAKGRFLDVLGGIRYYHLRSDLTLDSNIVASRFATASKDWVDAVGGVRGRAHLTPKLFLLGKADVGGGGSKFTYQLVGGLGYQISERIAIVGAYRDLSVDYDKDLFLFDMSLHGPIVGLGIKF